MVERKQGDDIDIDITATDDAGAALSIDDLAELYIYITHKNITFTKFSKAGASGFTALVKITAYQYRATIKSGLTKLADTGNYSIDANIVETDADYESSEKNTISIDDVFNLIASKSKASSSG